ncbi:SixA phosphatase family protein [Oryzifoliimicrobium ureilyticus]|uniref:SixA phosphatase family protein n=1 Tax=Oryzifoliimicrobium ureilyticus TaxID=3113724 RepID=UPI0030760E11
MRHAEAAPANPRDRDFDRTLTPRGYAAAEFIAERAADRTYVPQLILSSTARRCRDTAEAFQRIVSALLDIRYLDTLYAADSDVFMTLINSEEDVDTLMIVGHNPTIEQTLDRMIGHDSLQLALPNGFPPGTMAVIDRLDTSSAWQLVDVLVP